MKRKMMTWMLTSNAEHGVDDNNEEAGNDVADANDEGSDNEDDGDNDNGVDHLINNWMKFLLMQMKVVMSLSRCCRSILF